MVASIVVPNQVEAFSLEDYLQNPPEHMEWVDGQLMEKTGMTLKHGRIQLKLGSDWINYKNTHNLGGEVYTEAPCRTNKQIRRPGEVVITQATLKGFSVAID